MLMNVLLFVPLGLFLSFVFKSLSVPTFPKQKEITAYDYRYGLTNYFT